MISLILPLIDAYIYTYTVTHDDFQLFFLSHFLRQLWNGHKVVSEAWNNISTVKLALKNNFFVKHEKNYEVILVPEIFSNKMKH